MCDEKFVSLNPTVAGDARNGIQILSRGETEYDGDTKYGVTPVKTGSTVQVYYVLLNRQIRFETERQLMRLMQANKHTGKNWNTNWPLRPFHKIVPFGQSPCRQSKELCFFVRKH